MSDEIKTADALPEDKPKSFTIGVGEADHTVLKGANIENSNIGHIGDKIEVKDGGKVMTAEAVAAEAKLKQAKSDDVKDKVGKTLKDIFVPGHKVFGDIGTALDNATGCKKSTSRYDAAINELAGSKNVQVTNDSELSK
jgi:hypothetical protein